MPNSIVQGSARIRTSVKDGRAKAHSKADDRLAHPIKGRRLFVGHANASLTLCTDGCRGFFTLTQSDDRPR
jgi:hypothetical protein